ncbi:HAMP domain-containing protein [Clostridium chromiireducens]|uniref:histidine kinase n=1 Tax=Clostridium chromiireducens TaxID=225345 RepID=A0A964RL04_9CLOT|nr:HAMP domain-containing sensor histidine kinase [Clostridium chromiireducens]MVX63627.1 HAMP domain-containing protein [Clostridium chromiireducens]
MKKIKTKLFLVFMVLMVSLVLSGIVLNSIFLESYYIYKNKNILISTGEKIKDVYVSNKESSYRYMDMMESMDGIEAIVVTKDYNIEYNSLRLKSSEEENNLSKDIKKIILNNEKKLSKKYVYYIDEKNNAQKTRLVFVSKINDDKFIILKRSFKSIHDSVLIANEFYVFAGFIVIFTGSILILIFSSKITKPIIEMSNVAENISNLKFDEVKNIKSKDEIGVLAHSINKISDKLNSSIDELKQDVESKKELIRNMSHELKTPIGIIKGYAEGLKYGVANDKEKMDKYCSVLAEECDRMDKLVKELLNYSMMEGGIIKLNLTAFDVYEFMSKISERFMPVFHEKDISFTLDCIKNYKLYADKDLMEKAVNNFIINAINYVDERKIINVIIEEKENKIRISVFNTGNNIPEKELDKIWDVCYKVDKARARKYGGHGIGLSIVRLTAQLHGGTATAQNTNNGVIFFMEI